MEREMEGEVKMNRITGSIRVRRNERSIGVTEACIKMKKLKTIKLKSVNN
jgi:hypothetical protein